MYSSSKLFFSSAGVDSDGVRTADDAWVRCSAPLGQAGRARHTPRWDCDLSFSLAGGSTHQPMATQAKTLSGKIESPSPGEVLTIKATTTARVDEPRRRVVEDPELVERSQRRYYQRLKRKFEKPRKK